MSSLAVGRRNLDKRLATLRRSDALRRPPRGWVRALREAFGMTAAQFASRMGISQPRVSRLEKDEVVGAVTLNTLRRAAEAMECTLVYALVPKRPIEEILRGRAAAIAESRLAITTHTMALEDQALDAERLKLERQRLIEQLLKGKPKMLWEDP